MCLVLLPNLIHPITTLSREGMGARVWVGWWASDSHRQALPQLPNLMPLFLLHTHPSPPPRPYSFCRWSPTLRRCLSCWDQIC